MGIIERLFGILRAAGFADRTAFHAISATAAVARQTIGQADEDFEYGLRSIVIGIRRLGPLSSEE